MRKQEELDKIKSSIESIDLSIAGYLGLLKNEDNVNEFSNYEEQIRLLNEQKKGLESKFQQICEAEIALIEEEIQGRESLLKTLEKRGKDGIEQKNEIASLQAEMSEIEESLQKMGLSTAKKVENKENETEVVKKETIQEGQESEVLQAQMQETAETTQEEQQHKPMKSEQNKGRIKGMFQTLIAKLKQVREAQTKVDSELGRRNPEQVQEVVVEKTEMDLQNTTEQVEQNPQPQIPQQEVPAESPKQKLTTKFRKLLGMYAKTSLNLMKVNGQVQARVLGEKIKNSKVVQGMKNAAVITIGGAMATGEAMKNAKSTLQKAGKETVQNIVNAGRDRADSLVGKLEDSVYTKQARIAELQSDLQQGQKNAEPEVGSELEFA